MGYLTVAGHHHVVLGGEGVEQHAVLGGAFLDRFRCLFLGFAGSTLRCQFFHGLGAAGRTDGDAELVLGLAALLGIFRRHHITAFAHAILVVPALDAAATTTIGLGGIGGRHQHTAKQCDHCQPYFS